MTFRELVENKEMKIFGVKAIGNFYDKGKYQQSMDIFFVLSDTPENAVKLAKKNIDVITDMFKNKILSKKPALRKNETVPVKIGATVPKAGQESFNKVLTSKNKFESVDLNKINK